MTINSDVAFMKATSDLIVNGILLHVLQNCMKFYFIPFVRSNTKTKIFRLYLLTGIWINFHGLVAVFTRETIQLNGIFFPNRLVGCIVVLCPR